MESGLNALEVVSNTVEGIGEIKFGKDILNLKRHPVQCACYS